MSYQDQFPSVMAPGVPTTATPVENTNRTPSTTRPTLVTLYAIIEDDAGGSTADFAITVGAHTWTGGLWENQDTIATVNERICLGTFIVPANTAYKVVKTGSADTTSYSAEEQTL